MKTPIFTKSSFRFGVLKQWQSCVILFVFLLNSFGSLPLANASDFLLPQPGVMVRISLPFDPPILKGIKVHSNNPFQFDFILDQGDGKLSDDQLKNESSKLIKYFLASLTVPEKDLWVNLSPYEKDRIIPTSFGMTEMGRDLLAEDYMLKQITASLIYPEDIVGKKFWKRIYEEAQKKFGTTNISVNTFNKVWIMPQKAVVYENAKAGVAYVVESKLKVMLEQDYLSLAKHEGIQSVDKFKTPERVGIQDTSALGSQVVREIVIPALTKEVNENKNFAKLRQVYNSLILATWYKKKIKDSILAQVYADKSKVAGVNIDDPKENERIYQQYLRAFKKGVFNYIKEEPDPMTQETVPRKYFSGGLRMNMAMMSIVNVPGNLPSTAMKIEVSLKAAEALKPILAIKTTDNQLSASSANLSMKAKAAEWRAFIKAQIDEFKFRNEDSIRMGHEIVKSLTPSQYMKEDALPALKELFNIKYWPVLYQLLKDAGKEHRVFLYGLPVLRKMIHNEEDLKRIGGVLVELSRKLSPGPMAKDRERIIFQDGLLLIRNLIKTESDLRRMGNDLVELFNLDRNGWLTAEFIKEYFSETKGLFDEEVLGKYWSEIVNGAKQNMERTRNGYALDDITIRLFRELLKNERSLKFVNDKNEKQKLIFLKKVLEPFVFAYPQELTLSMIQQLSDVYKNEESFKYFLYYLSSNNKTSAIVREWVQGYIKERGLFKLQDTVTKQLKTGEKKVLIIQNLQDGMGDELIRMITLTQGLLDYNPDLKITIVTAYPFIYDHPRVKVVRIPEVENNPDWEGWKEKYDVVVDHYNIHPSLEGVSYSQKLEKLFLASDLFKKAFLGIRTEIGEHYFTFEQVELNGHDYVENLSLNKVRIENVYEPSFRLAAELGLPLRVGDYVKVEESIINGIPYPEAEKKWGEMMAKVNNQGSDGKYEKPVVLFNPFGGMTEGKGIMFKRGDERELEKVLKSVTEFVKEGYKVVLAPNGTDWGTEEKANYIRMKLPLGIRENCVVALDPRIDKRMYKYFVGYADYVFTVEGGLVHLTYNISSSKPFNIFNLPQNKKWTPFGKTVFQEVFKDPVQAIRDLKNEKTGNKGGIDLTPDHMNLQTENSGEEIKFKIDPSMLKEFQNAPGFVPVIINIRPLTNLRTFLGLTSSQASV